MHIIPAIDIRNGKVVRLYQGDYGQQTDYAEDPCQVAQQWINEGAHMLHLVDLDGAKEGRPVNHDIIRQIVQLSPVPVQVGGGLREHTHIQQMIEYGVARTVIGTKAFDYDFLSGLIRSFGKHIVVGIDAVDGNVKTEGWLADGGLTVELLCERISKMGVQHIVFTDIKRDGTLSGPNIDALKRVLHFKELSVVASGGIGRGADVAALRALNAENLFGVIIGKALYEKKITIKEALNNITDH